MTGCAMWSVISAPTDSIPLDPRCKGGYPLKFTLGQRREIRKIAMSKPAERDLPFFARSRSKLAEFLVAEVPYR